MRQGWLDASGHPLFCSNALELRRTLIPKPTSRLVQLCTEDEYLVNAMSARAWALAVLIRR
jgi:hypothetical protein